jgi:hypothetical protein
VDDDDHDGGDSDDDEDDDDGDDDHGHDHEAEVELECEFEVEVDDEGDVDGVKGHVKVKNWQHCCGGNPSQELLGKYCLLQLQLSHTPTGRQTDGRTDKHKRKNANQANHLLYYRYYRQTGTDFLLVFSMETFWPHFLECFSLNPCLEPFSFGEP